MATGVPTPGLWDVLAAAAERQEHQADQLREDAVSSQEIVNATTSLLAGVRHFLDTDEPALGLLSSPLSRRLLGVLRREFLYDAAALTPAADPAEVVRYLSALERVAEQLDPRWDERFTDRLSGPDGLDLVVEVAHDLRSPLTSILFLAETLLRGRSGAVTALQERQLGLIYGAAFGLSSVASDVVELVRGRDRLTSLDPMPFSISEILLSVRDIVRPIAEEKGLRVELLSPEEGLRVGHPVALNRVLLNLTTNALKFTDEGFVELGATERSGDVIEFSVRDSGRGIPAKAMAMLYEPFRRRERDREYAFSGSGLGLSICRKLVEAMGGELQVETEVGKGTRFFFELAIPAVGSEAAGPASRTVVA